MSKNRTIFLIIVIFAVSISAFATMIASLSNVNDWQSTTCYTAMGILFEACACFSLKMASEIKEITENSDGNRKIKYMNTPTVIFSSILIYLAVSAYCIYWTASLTYHKSDIERNKTIVESASLQNQLKSKQIAEDLYKTKKAELENLESTKKKLVSEKLDTKNLWSYKAATKRGNIDNEAAQISKDMQNRIDEKSRELSSISAQINAPISANAEILSSGGTYGLIKNETFQTWFFVIFGALVNIIAAWATIMYNISSWYYDQSFKKSPTPPEDKTKKSRPSSDESTVTPKKNEILGGRLQGLKFYKKKKQNSEFRPIKYLVDEKEIQQYLDFILDNLKPSGAAPGRETIMKELGFTQEKCRTIHNILKQRGILQTGNKVTKVMKEVV